MRETMTSLERDSLSRERILSEINENFFVEAGAGSGKTSMLVKRMIAMVEAGIDISRICAITFTRAAAGEFYERFQQMLIQRSNPDLSEDAPVAPGQLPHPTDLSRKRCLEALQNIDLCFMGTIDAFCGMVLSEHPSEAGIPSDAGIASDEDAAAVYAQQYVRICSGAFGDELRSLAKAFQALHRNPQEVFVKGISFIMNNRNVHFNYCDAAGLDIDRVFADDRDDLIRAVKCLMNHPELRYDGERKSREAWETISESYKNIRGRWSNNFSNVIFGLKSLKDIRLIPEAMNHYAASLGPVFAPGGKQGKWLELVPGREDGLLNKLKKLQYDVSMTFLLNCVPVMGQAMREKGRLTYFDYLYYLRNMLKKDAEGDGKLIRYIYNRHSYFLIDEFQDTNPMQAEVFFYLSSEKPVPQWSTCVPRPGSLFIVGDPKQSIYRFRSADVTSFLKVKRLFEKNGGAILELSRNFRSTRTLCEYYNRVFSALLPEETEYQSKFEDIPLPEPKAGDFQGIFTYQAYTGRAVEDHPDMSDPIQIANIIEKLTGNESFQIRAEGEKEPRPIRYSDFMVITYGKSKLGPIMAELDAREIPSRVEGDVPFSETEALIEISRIYSAVSDAGDTLALYGALTGKLFGFTKEDILQFKANGGAVSLKSAPEIEHAENSATLRVSQQLSKLRELHLQADRYSPAVLFSKIMDDFQIYRVCSDENLEVVYYALELLRNAEKSGQVISLKDGSALVQRLISGESGEERCLSLEADRDCVHMANLHKVKGLEAPIVILAAASEKNFSATYRILHGDSGSEGFLFSLEGERNEKGVSTKYFETDAYPDEKAAENEALKAEGCRLIYVAATRARNALILCNSIKMMRGKEVPDSKWSPVTEAGIPDIFDYIGDVPKKPRQHIPEVNASSLYEEAVNSSTLCNRTAENKTYTTENPSRLQVSSKIEDSMNEVTRDSDRAAVEVKESAEKQQFPALLGTMVHKLMEILVTTDNKIGTDDAISEIVREYQSPQVDRYKEDLRQVLTNVALQIRNGGYVQTNGLPQNILGTLLDASEVYCEVPYCYLDETDEEKTVWRGTMDVIYSDSNGWHIIDYKTNADGNDLDLKYQAQLKAYVKAFKAITGLDAEALTYHIDI